MIKEIIIKSIIILSVLFQFSIAKAQFYKDNYPSYTLTNTELRTLDSEINGVTYKLYISYPTDYQTDTDENYPIVFLLDADYSFAIAKNATDHLSKWRNFPKVILIGIAYAGEDQYLRNRTRDYTPTHIQQAANNLYIPKVSGGGPAFLDFLKSELFPFVEENFRTSGKKILAGHSFGGLFATWVMLHKPELFNGYIAISPSLWYDNRYLFDLEKETVKTVKNASIQLYLTVGKQEVGKHFNMPRDLQEFTERLQSRGHPHLSIRSEILSGENHNSVFPGAFTRGIRFILNAN